MAHSLFIYSDSDQKILDLYDHGVMDDSDILFSSESNRIFARGTWYSVSPAQINSAVSAHNSSPSAHADIRELIDGLNTSLVFDSDTQISQWLAGTYTRLDNITPSGLAVGNRLYTTAQGSNNYIVSHLPVTQLSDLKVLSNAQSLVGVLLDSNSLSDLSDKQLALNNLLQIPADSEFKTLYIDENNDAKLIDMPVTYGKTNHPV